MPGPRNRRHPDRIRTAIITALGASVAMVTPAEVVAEDPYREGDTPIWQKLDFYVDEGWAHLFGLSFDAESEFYIGKDLDAETLARAPQSVKKAYQCFYVADRMLREYPSWTEIKEITTREKVREVRDQVDFYIPEIEQHVLTSKLRTWREEVEKDPSVCKYKSSNPCFISTAVFNARGEDDDCYELTTLRRFRDNWVKQTPDGERLVKRYYDIAPAIVSWIERLPSRKDILEAIFEERLAPMIRAIEVDDNPLAFSYYIDMVEVLENAYRDAH